MEPRLKGPEKHHLATTTKPCELFLSLPFLDLHAHILPLAMAPTDSPTGAQINLKIDSLPQAVANKLPHVPESKEQLKENVAEVKTKSLSGLRSLAAGGFGGVCAVIVGHPFDLVKVRLQTAERGVYKSAIDVVRKSVAKDGLGRGLYAGVSAPLVGVTPMCKCCFDRWY